MKRKPAPIFIVGKSITLFGQKKSKKVVEAVFNPIQAPKSNAWYYALNDNPNNYYRENVLVDMIQPQLEMFRIKDL
jgi:hypothetical protein